MTDKPLDQASLLWIRGEIEHSSELAITALEGYFDHGDPEYLDQARTNLHQIYGTLQIVELYPPSTLAHELEITLNYIATQKVSLQPTDISELIRCIQLINQFIESILFDDTPLTSDQLLHPLNLLRTLRNEPLVDPLKKTPDYFQDENLQTAQANQQNIHELSVKLLKLYQFSYLKFVNKENRPANLVYMNQATQRFSRLFPQPNIAPLWSAVLATMETLQIDHQFEAVDQVEEYLGKLGQLLKSFASPKSTTIDGKVLASLLIQTLGILQNLANKTPIAEKILELHKDKLETAKPAMAPPALLTKSTLGAISDALMEELGYIKDALDHFSRTPGHLTQSLENLYSRLKHVADSMIMVNELEIPRQSLHQEIIQLDQLITTGESPSENWLINLATTLLFVESSIQTIKQKNKPVAFQKQSAKDVLVSARKSLLREILIDLARIKSIYVDSVSANWEQQNILLIRNLFSETESRLFYIDEFKAIQLIEQINQYVTYDLANRNEPPAWPDVETFADIIAALDQYLYLRIDTLSPSTKLLEVAQEKLLHMFTVSDEQLASQVDDDHRHQELASQQSPESKTSRVDQDKQPETSAPETALQDTVSPDHDTLARAELSDDEKEIQEIFLEELEEITSELKGFVYNLSNNSEDFGILGSIRRLVHTIKGSGRVAQLPLISEPAWALEQRLNEHLEKNEALSLPFIHLISQFTEQASAIASPGFQGAASLSKKFLDAFTAPESLQNEADQTNQITETDQTSNQHQIVEESSEQVESADVAVDDNEQTAQPHTQLHAVQETETFEQFEASNVEVSEQWFSQMQLNEIAGHLTQVNHYLRTNQPYYSQAPQNQELLRALHTLKAIFNSVEYPLLSAQFTTFEHQVRLLMKTDNHKSLMFFESLDICASLIAAIVAQESDIDSHIERLALVNQQLENFLGTQGPLVSPYEVWLQQNYALFDLLINADALFENADNLRASFEIFSDAATSATSLSLNALQETIDCFILYLRALLNLDKSHDQDIFETAKKMSESILNLADRIALGQGSIELDSIRQLFQDNLNNLQAYLAQKSSALNSSATDEIEPKPQEHAQQQDIELLEEAQTEDENLEDQQADEIAAAELMAIFKDELNEILDSIDQQLKIFLNGAATFTNLQELQRDYHTIKGGSNYINEQFLYQLARETDLICERYLDARQLIGQDVVSILLLTQNLFRFRLQNLPTITPLSDAELQVIKDLQETKPKPIIREAPEEEFQAIEQAANDVETDNDLESQESTITPIESLIDIPTSNELVAPDEEQTFLQEYQFLTVDDENSEIIEIFLDEAKELLTELGEICQKLDHDQLLEATPHMAHTTLRIIHTLKGGARLAGIQNIGDRAQILEQNLENSSPESLSHHLAALKSFSNEVQKNVDALAELLERFQNQDEASADEQEFIGRTADTQLSDIELTAIQNNSENDDTNINSTINQAPISEKIIASQTPYDQPTSENNPKALSPQVTAKTESLAEFDQEILEIFFEESKELVEELEKAISSIDANSINEAIMDQLKRILHTIKGSARLAGFSDFGNQAHLFESHLETLRTPTQPNETAQVIVLNDQLFAALQKILEAIEDHLHAPQPVAKPSVASSTDSMQQRQTLAIQKAKPRLAKRKKNKEVVRIGADLLERLVNLAGETVISRSSVQQELLGFNRIIDEFGLTLDRIRDQIRAFENETESRMLSASSLQQLQLAHSQGTSALRQSSNGHSGSSHYSDSQYTNNHYDNNRDYQGNNDQYQEFDTLEMDRFSAFHQLARSLSETASDLIDMRDSMIDKVRTTETLVMQQSRVQTQLHEGLMQSRMVPFSRLAPRLTRMVRQVADELGKKAELTIVNAEGEMDRSVLERMIPPLEHMLRNALDHGIEMPEIRLQNGKSEIGQITLHLFREGNEIVLRLQDDGAGIAVDKVRSKAIEQGLLTPQAQLTEKEILQFIFKPGFSTATQVTQISGRGVGMDVVFSEIKQLNGTLKLHAVQGAGTQFTVRLPFTVSMSRALMVKIGEENFAIPLSHIEGVVRVSPYELNAIYESEERSFSYAGKVYEVNYLGHYLQTKTRNSEVTESVPLILARNTERSVAVQVDTLIGSREIVIKNPGSQLNQVVGLSGATILGDGSVVIILDLNSLIRDDIAQNQLDNSDEITAVAPKESSSSINPLVMVVDDSVTVRKVTSRLLERHGMDVVTAKDGIDAVTQLRDITPDLILLDIEMPRMDGFEVASHVRHDPRLLNIPIIMISSRTGDKHRSRAAGLGVNHFLGKPYQELQLIEHINELVQNHEK